MRVDHATGLRVGGKALEAVDLLLSRQRRRFAMAPEHGPHARDQLARIKRFAEIVVGADLKADDAVDVLFERGEEDDRHVGALCPQVAAKIEPGAVWQHDIENNEIDMTGRQLLVQLMAARGKQYAEALAFDIAGEQLADLRIVVGDENALRRAHQDRF